MSGYFLFQGKTSAVITSEDISCFKTGQRRMRSFACSRTGKILLQDASTLLSHVSFCSRTGLGQPICSISSVPGCKQPCCSRSRQAFCSLSVLKVGRLSIPEVQWDRLSVPEVGKFSVPEVGRLSVPVVGRLSVPEEGRLSFPEV
jgi:hypothetical protein